MGLNGSYLFCAYVTITRLVVSYSYRDLEHLGTSDAWCCASKHRTKSAQPYEQNYMGGPQGLELTLRRFYVALFEMPFDM